MIRFVSVTSFRVEVKNIAIQELRHRATKCGHWEMMFIVSTPYGSLPAIPSLPFDRHSTYRKWKVPVVS